MKTSTLVVRGGAMFIALACLACGATAPDRLSSSEADALRERAASAERDAPRPRRRANGHVRRLGPIADPPPPPDAAVAALREEVGRTLPPPPADALWADGFSDTQHDAVRQAKRAVSEQISARIEAETRSFEAEYGDRSENEASIAIKTTTAFDHAELIKVIGAVKAGNGFAARAMLDKDEAAHLYAGELAADRARLERLGPTLKQAVARHDAAVLLDTHYSPSHILAEMRRKARILAVLGRVADVEADRETIALAQQATRARSGSTVRLTVDGEVSEALEAAVVGEIGRVLADRGCRLVVRGVGPAMDGTLPEAPVVDAVLRINSRDHREVGVLWRYVGFAVEMSDARSGQAVFRYSAMPEMAHGGGPNWAMADQAVARRLRQKIDAVAVPAFQRLICR